MLRRHHTGGRKHVGILTYGHYISVSSTCFGASPPSYWHQVRLRAHSAARMISLRLLGGLALQDESTTLSGPATRRRSLALLALLAAAETRGVAREKLLIYLWPESNTQRARNSLNQTLWSIRQHLGEDVVVGTTTLRLNPERVSCDLWEYREALRRGDVATAARLREGELLET